MKELTSARRDLSILIFRHGNAGQHGNARRQHGNADVNGNVEQYGHAAAAAGICGDDERNATARNHGHEPGHDG